MKLSYVVEVPSSQDILMEKPPTMNSIVANPRRGVEVFAHYPNDGGNGGIGVLAYYTYGDSFFFFTTAVCSGSEVYNHKISRAILRHNFAMGDMVKWPIIGMNRHEICCRDIRDSIDGLVSSLFN